MKNIFKINVFAYIAVIISILIGTINEMIIITTLIVIHEIGHCLTAYFFHVKIKNITIYPLGGISKFEMSLNIEIYKEFLILIMGPIFQFLAYYILIKMMPMKIDMIKFYHYNILYFNLLPIYPLDGGKLLNIIISKFIPYKASLILTLKIGYITAISFFIIKNTFKINMILTEIVLLLIISSEKNKVDTMYNKFLLERYLKKYNFKSSKIINNQNNLYRNKRHLIKICGKYYTENEFLEKKFKKNKKN